MLKTVFRVVIVVALLSVELYAVYAALHPHVSSEYQAYFIDRSTKDWHPLHYRATPDEGISFSTRGWPNFVLSTSGFSFQEDWGRWTDGGLAQTPKIIMNQQFSGPLCLDIKARPAYGERGKTLTVALGNNTGRITLFDPDYATYRLSFQNAQPANTLEFRFDGTVPINSDVLPASRDGRRLGIGTVWLKIRPSICSTK